MTIQTEEDLSAGLLRLRLGSAETVISALPAAAVDKWRALLDTTLQGVATSSLDPATTLLALATQMTDRAVELIVAYDRDHELGTPEHIRETATPQQIRRTLEAMRESALPFGDEVQMVSLFMSAAAAASDALNSTNGHSPTGAKAPRKSAPSARTRR